VMKAIVLSPTRKKQVKEILPDSPLYKRGLISIERDKAEGTSNYSLYESSSEDLSPKMTIYQQMIEMRRREKKNTKRLTTRAME